MVAVLVLAVTLTRSPPVDQSPTPRAGSSLSSPSVTWPTPRAASASAPPRVISSGGFLADLDVVVYALTSDSVLRLDSRAGRITRTAGLTDSSEGGSVSFLAGPDRVIVRSMDDNPGFVVVDGQPARPLTGLLAEGDFLLPGPRGRLWVIGQTSNGVSTARLTDLAGRRVFSTVRFRGEGSFEPDGKGGLLYNGVSGIYRGSDRGLRRVTTGQVVAAGAGHLLMLECDARYVCSTYLQAHGSNTRRRIGSASGDQLGSGRLSADGRYAAVAPWNAYAGPALRVTDLRSGRVLASLPLDVPYPVYSSMTWLPDGRLLGITEGRLFLFDPRTRKSVRSDLDLPPVTQVVLREN